MVKFLNSHKSSHFKRLTKKNASQTLKKIFKNLFRKPIILAKFSLSIYPPLIVTCTWKHACGSSWKIHSYRSHEPRYCWLHPCQLRNSAIAWPGQVQRNATTLNAMPRATSACTQPRPRTCVRTGTGSCASSEIQPCHSFNRLMGPSSVSKCFQFLSLFLVTSNGISNSISLANLSWKDRDLLLSVGRGKADKLKESCSYRD